MLLKVSTPFSFSMQNVWGMTTMVNKIAARLWTVSSSHVLKLFIADITSISSTMVYDECIKISLICCCWHCYLCCTRLTIQMATNKKMKVQVPNKSNNTFCLDSVGGYGSLILHDHVQHILTWHFTISLTKPEEFLMVSLLGEWLGEWLLLQYLFCVALYL